MNEDFEIPVHFRGKDLSYTARLLQYGYSYKIEVDLPEGSVLFEPDEERNWRVMIEGDKIEKGRQPERELLQALVESLEAITK
jgi:hypothetical protein